MRPLAFYTLVGLVLGVQSGAWAERPHREATRPAVSGARIETRAKKRSTLETRLHAELSRIRSGKYLRRGTTAIYVAEAKTGTPVVSVHEDERLNPASNVKLISTAAALHILGPDWRYPTRLLGPAPSRDGVVAGDVYLVGSFDPTLKPEHLTAMAGAMKAAGIMRIHGDIHIDARRWRTSVSRPRIKIRVTGADMPGPPPVVEVVPRNSYVAIEMLATTESTGGKRKRRPKIALDSYGVENSLCGDTHRIAISGTIAPGQSTAFSRRLRRGHLFSAGVLRQALIDAGIAVDGTVISTALPFPADNLPVDAQVELARHESRPLSEIVSVINKYSINRLADRVIMTAGAARYGGDPTMTKGVRAMEEWLRDQTGIDTTSVVLDTGSGLSYNTELSAHQIVNVLRVAGGYASNATRDKLAAGNLSSVAGGDLDASEYETAFRNSLAVAGVDGTLRRRFRRSPARGKVIGKTGTLTRVIALAGILDCGTDNSLVFAIVSNGHRHSRRGSVRRRHEAIVEALQRYLRARKQQNTASR